MISSPPRDPLPQVGCFHGGAFFEAIGVEFDDLARRERIINADVLDACFRLAESDRGPAQNLSGCWRRSPPVEAEGMVRSIARVRQVDADRSFHAAALRCHFSGIAPLAECWLARSDPRSYYGEYAHVLERVIECSVDRFSLARARATRLISSIGAVSSRHYTLVVWSTEQSDWSAHTRAELMPLLARAPQQTRFGSTKPTSNTPAPMNRWNILPPPLENVVVCKSMSKVYALSGARAASLCASPRVIAELRAITPPWSVVCRRNMQRFSRWVIRLLSGPLCETHFFAAQPCRDLREALPGIEIVLGVANFLLCHLPATSPTRQRSRTLPSCGLFLRDATSWVVSSVGMPFESP